MKRLVLLVIAVGVAVGLMMPSDLAVTKADRSGRAPTHMVESPQYASASTPPPTVISGTETVLKRGPGGHFFTDVLVNGTQVHFLVDTGASGVALTTADAQKVGLLFNEMEFAVIGSGASGPVRGKMVMLDRVSLGDRTAEQVEGAIIEGGEMSLLGQSFLARMGKIEIEGDRMVIR